VPLPPGHQHEHGHAHHSPYPHAEHPLGPLSLRRAG
jgi:sirohydrochlorin cobaltochelatase